MIPEAFPWPAPSGSAGTPRWNGQGFEVDGRVTPVLSYGTNVESWDDTLTVFHEGAAGEDHFIDIASRRQAVGSLLRWLSVPEPVVLEVGSSSGFLLGMIRQALPKALIIGSDSFPDALQRISRDSPGFPLMQFDLLHCPLPDACVDAVVLLNVLEHIRDHAGALRETARILKPGGIIIVEVPAGPRLYDVYDELLHHHRRYAMKELRQITVDADLEIVWASHLGVLLYPGFALVKLMNRHLLGREEKIQKQNVGGNIQRTRHNPWMDGIMRMEYRFGRWIRYPFGIRCEIVGRKPTLKESAP